MSGVLRIAVAPGSVADPDDVAAAATAIVAGIGRIMHGRDCRVAIEESPETDAFLIELDGRPLVCPPVLASQLAAVAADRSDVPIRPLEQSWAAAAQAPDVFLLELVRAVATGMPREIFGDRAWAAWLRMRDQDVDLLIPSGLFEMFTRIVPGEQIPIIRNWLAAFLGVAPPMHLLRADDLPPYCYAVALGGVRLPARRFLSTEYIAINGDPGPLLERGARPTSLPWTLREALVIDQDDAGDATAESWWSWNDDWAASVYADVRRHADWLVDDGFTDSLLRALATTMPEAAQAAYDTVRSRLTAVIGRLLAADVWSGSIEPIVGALWDCPPGADAESDERAVRDRLARGIVDPHLSNGWLDCWSAVDADNLNLPSLVVATRRAVDALPGTARVPVLLVAERDRAAAASALRFSVPEVRVLSLDDVPLDIEVNPQVLDIGDHASMPLPQA